MTNRKPRFFPSILIATALALIAAPALAQHDHGGDAGDASADLPESFGEPMPLFETALGDHHHPISSQNEKAQAYFDQGFRLMYAFGKEDAVRSFRESWKHDPDCAICYWGEAWAWGSYLNGPMRPFEAPFAYAAMQEAVARIDGASPKERPTSRPSPSATSRTSIRPSGATRTRPTPRRCGSWPRRTPTISTRSPSTAMRSSCWSRAAARAT